MALLEEAYGSIGPVPYAHQINITGKRQSDIAGRFVHRYGSSGATPQVDSDWFQGLTQGEKNGENSQDSPTQNHPRDKERSRNFPSEGCHRDIEETAGRDVSSPTATMANAELQGATRI